MLSGSHDFEVFAVDLVRRGTFLAQTFQQVIRLFFPTHRSQVPGTVRQHLDEKGKDQGGDALESK